MFKSQVVLENIVLNEGGNEKEEIRANSVLDFELDQNSLNIKDTFESKDKKGTKREVLRTNIPVREIGAIYCDELEEEQKTGSIFFVTLSVLLGLCAIFAVYAFVKIDNIWKYTVMGLFAVAIIVLIIIIFPRTKVVNSVELVIKKKHSEKETEANYKDAYFYVQVFKTNDEIVAKFEELIKEIRTHQDMITPFKIPFNEDCKNQELDSSKKDSFKSDDEEEKVVDENEVVDNSTLSKKEMKEAVEKALQELENKSLLETAKNKAPKKVSVKKSELTKKSTAIKPIPKAKKVTDVISDNKKKLSENLEKMKHKVEAQKLLNNDLEEKSKLNDDLEVNNKEE